MSLKRVAQTYYMNRARKSGFIKKVRENLDTIGKYKNIKVPREVIETVRVIKDFPGHPLFQVPMKSYSVNTEVVKHTLSLPTKSGLTKLRKHAEKAKAAILDRHLQETAKGLMHRDAFLAGAVLLGTVGAGAAYYAYKREKKRGIKNA
jgi:hypothetical protein